MEKRPPSRKTLTIDSVPRDYAPIKEKVMDAARKFVEKGKIENSDTQPKKRRKLGSTLGLAAAIMGASGSGVSIGGTVSNPRPYRSGRRAGLSDAGHMSRAMLAGVPGTTRNKLKPAVRKARRNHRRAMRNRMGYR